MVHNYNPSSFFYYNYIANNISSIYIWMLIENDTEL